MTSPPNRLLQERRLGAGALSLILLGQWIAAVLPLVFFRCTMVRSKWSSSIFHEPVGDGRQRDIFPIPSLDAGGLTGWILACVRFCPHLLLSIVNHHCQTMPFQGVLSPTVIVKQCPFRVFFLQSSLSNNDLSGCSFSFCISVPTYF